MGTPISAKNAKVDWEGTVIAHAADWTLTESSENPEFATSSTAGYKNRVAGHADVSGSFDIYYDPDADWRGILKRGDIGTLKLYRDATKFWEDEVIIDDTEETAPIEAGDPVKVTFSFSHASGAITIPV